MLLISMSFGFPNLSTHSSYKQNDKVGAPSFDAIERLWCLERKGNDGLGEAYDSLREVSRCFKRKKMMIWEKLHDGSVEETRWFKRQICL